MHDALKESKYGYLSIKEMPSKEKLEEYYEQKYFQTAQGSYEHIYILKMKRYTLKIVQKFLNISCKSIKLTVIGF